MSLIDWVVCVSPSPHPSYRVISSVCSFSLKNFIFAPDFRIVCEYMFKQKIDLNARSFSFLLPFAPFSESEDYTHTNRVHFLSKFCCFSVCGRLLIVVVAAMLFRKNSNLMAIHHFVQKYYSCKCLSNMAWNPSLLKQRKARAHASQSGAHVTIKRTSCTEL